MVQKLPVFILFFIPIVLSQSHVKDEFLIAPNDLDGSGDVSANSGVDRKGDQQPMGPPPAWYPQRPPGYPPNFYPQQPYGQYPPQNQMMPPNYYQPLSNNPESPQSPQQLAPPYSNSRTLSNNPESPPSQDRVALLNNNYRPLSNQPPPQNHGYYNPPNYQPYYPPPQQGPYQQVPPPGYYQPPAQNVYHGNPNVAKQEPFEYGGHYYQRVTFKQPKTADLTTVTWHNWVTKSRGAGEEGKKFFVHSGQSVGGFFSGLFGRRK